MELPTDPNPIDRGPPKGGMKSLKVCQCRVKKKKLMENLQEFYGSMLLTSVLTWFWKE